MKKNLFFSIKMLTVALIATAFLLNSCKSSKNKATKEVINTELNSTFNINLASNPSTGYTWFISKFDSTALNLTERVYTSDPNPNKMVGVGGTEALIFKAAKKGKYTLEFVYKRASDATGTDTRKVTVKVK